MLELIEYPRKSTVPSIKLKVFGYAESYLICKLITRKTKILNNSFK